MTGEIRLRKRTQQIKKGLSSGRGQHISLVFRVNWKRLIHTIKTVAIELVFNIFGMIVPSIFPVFSGHCYSLFYWIPQLSYTHQAGDWSRHTWARTADSEEKFHALPDFLYSGRPNMLKMYPLEICDLQCSPVLICDAFFTDLLAIFWCIPMGTTQGEGPKNVRLSPGTTVRENFTAH